MKLVVREMWNTAFSDKSSADYKTFENSLKKSIEDLYREKNSHEYSIITNLVDVTR